jgi:hypothetical protein
MAVISSDDMYVDNVDLPPAMTNYQYQHTVALTARKLVRLMVSAVGDEPAVPAMVLGASVVASLCHVNKIFRNRSPLLSEIPT